MTNWRIHSVVGDQWFYFPSGYTLNAGATVYVHSGPDAFDSPPTDLLWGYAYIWNNDGDEAVLYNDVGQEIDRYGYSSPPTNCSPCYPDVCIPPPPPDLNCADIVFRNFRVVGCDPHRFDGDNDGIGC
jgi:hypothetical protein